MDTIWLWYAFVSALVVFSFSPRLYEICWLLFYPRTAESVWSISVIGEWRCCGPVGRSCSALSLFHLPLHPDLLHLQHPDLHHQTTWELIWSEPGVHFLLDVLISWADRGSCAHKCICQGCQRFETSVFFSEKINISTTGGSRVGFFQPDTNHP